MISIIDRSQRSCLTLRDGLALLTCAFLFWTGQARAEPLTGKEFLGRPVVEGGERITYGAETSQFASLWMPGGAVKPPIVVIVHGGCWSTAYPDLTMMNPVADALQRRGIAVWNVEYRRAEEAGGGWPGTYEDIDHALAKLQEVAASRALDGQRMVIIGYSAGAQLALISAQRFKNDSDTKLTLKGVVSLGGILDLANQSAAIAAACGASAPMAKMIPRMADEQSGQYNKVSPAQAFPFAFPVTLFHGVLDNYSPPYMGLSMLRAARSKGETVNLRVLQDTGHFDMIAPDRPAWGEVVSEVERLLNS